MPMKLSEVGRMYQGTAGAVRPASPAEAILASQPGVNDPADAVPARAASLSLPEPANRSKIAMLRQQLYKAQLKVRQATVCLETLYQASERAHDDSLAACRAVEAAARIVAEARKFGGRHLAAAYINGEDTAGSDLATAQAALESATRQREHSQEVEGALRDEIAVVETSLSQLHGQRDQALASLVCISPELIALYRRQAALWVELRSLRLCMHAIGSALGGGGLDHTLLGLAQVVEPISDRRVGFEVDEGLISTWVGAVARLREDANAALPGNNSNPEVRDGDRGSAPPREPHGAVLTPRRTMLRERADGPGLPTPLDRARPARDPATGKFRKKAAVPG